MTLSLRQRLALLLVPLLILPALVGVAGVVLLERLSQRIDLILRENYDSVRYMQRLNEALERIDSSFGFALAGREDKARAQYATFWPQYLAELRSEEGNITLPGEQGAVDELATLTREYQARGKEFYDLPAGDQRRNNLYFDKDGLEDTFIKIKKVSGDILEMNQKNMVDSRNEAKRTARGSVIGFAVALAVSGVFGVALAIWTARELLRPIRAVTDSALEIGLGNLDQVLPVTTHDELGRLAEAFNTMSRHLRGYRQSDYARLLRAQRTSQATIDSFPHPVLVVDPEGRVEMANPAARHLVAAGGPNQQTAQVWNPPEPLRQPLNDALAHQRPYLPEGFEHAVAIPLDGKEHSFLPRILPIRDPYGNTLGAAVLLEDVTRFRLLDQVKSDLVATVSHELKTPLTGVRLALHLLLEETIGPLTPKQTELLLDARDNAERLVAMVNNLLDLARLEEGDRHLQLAPEEPVALLRAAAEAIAPRAEAKDVHVVVEAAPDLLPVAADAQRLGHALNNLVDNALTYTDRGGRITLSAAADGDRVLLTVADTGVGIPPEFLPHVFEKFFRVPGQTHPAGTGLGLAIVREIVVAHNGTITCESRVGEGTTFRIRLPVWSGQPAAMGH